MTYKEAWEAIDKLLTEENFYASNSTELQYLLGYIDALNMMIKKGNETDED